MIIELPDAILLKAQTTEKTVRLHVAIALFKEELLTLGQAALVAELPQLIFQQELGKRKIPVHYGVEELLEDLEHIKLA